MVKNELKMIFYQYYLKIKLNFFGNACRYTYTTLYKQLKEKNKHSCTLEYNTVTIYKHLKNLKSKSDILNLVKCNQIINF